MIELRNITKTYKRLDGKRKTVLDGVNLSIADHQNVGILGRNGAGKSVMLRIIGGLELPDKGGVITNGRRISWPLGTPSGVHGSLTGLENIRFICKIYDKDYEEMLRFVEDFAELKDYLAMPVKTYSSGMKGRLGFGISMAIDFDTYLIDEGFSAGDASFRQKSEDLFTSRRDRANMIVVSHEPATIQAMCNSVAVLHKGQIRIFDDVTEGIEVYQSL